MAVKVIVPNKHYNEKFAGMDFVNGEAIVEDEKHARKIAASFGYEIVELEKPKSEPKKAAAKKPTKKATKKVEDRE